MMLHLNAVTAHEICHIHLISLHWLSLFAPTVPNWPLRLRCIRAINELSASLIRSYALSRRFFGSARIVSQAGKSVRDGTLNTTVRSGVFPFRTSQFVYPLNVNDLLGKPENKQIISCYYY